MSEFPTLAEVVAKHAWYRPTDRDLRRRPWMTRCVGCNWIGDTRNSRMDQLALHAEHVQAVWRDACTIATVEQLDALPLDTVVVDAVGIPRTKRHGNSHMSAGWTHAGNSPLKSNELADGRPMCVVSHPDWSKP